MLVYGPSAVFGPRKQRNLDEEMARHQDTKHADDSLLHRNPATGTGITAEVLPDAWFGQHIPLEQHGLRRRSERVRSRRWEVYIVIGQKVQ
jgi:hypothetical protein